MSSKALAVKKALRDKLSARPELAGVDVTYGFPTRQPGRRWVGFAEVEWQSAEWSTNRSRSETFAITVVLDVQSRGGTSEEAETAVFDLAAVFEEVLTDDPGINDLCVTSGYRPLRLKSWPIDTGYESQYEIEVTATCRP